MPYLDELYAAQPANAEITPGVGQQVNWGHDPAWWQAGGHFTTNDVLPTAAAALGGLAGAVGSGARGLAWEAIRQGGGEAAKRYLRDPAERMFDTASRWWSPGGPAPSNVARAATGSAALGLGYSLADQLQNPLVDWIAAKQRAAGLGIEFPPATQAHPAYRTGRR